MTRVEHHSALIRWLARGPRCIRLDRVSDRRVKVVHLHFNMHRHLLTSVGGGQTGRTYSGDVLNDR